MCCCLQPYEHFPIHVISFKRASGKFCFHFREVFQQCIETHRKILNSDKGDFQILVKYGMFYKKFWGSFQGASLIIKEDSHVCFPQDSLDKAVISG